MNNQQKTLQSDYNNLLGKFNELEQISQHEIEKNKAKDKNMTDLNESFEKLNNLYSRAEMENLSFRDKIKDFDKT